MSIIQGHAKGGLTPFYPKTLNGSLRFNDDDSAYLSWTPASAGDQDKWAWSAWVKRANVNSESYLFSAGTSTSELFYIQFRADANSNKISIVWRDGSTTTRNLVTNASYRDPSAWYHIVLTLDVAQASDADKMKLYVNGELVTSFSADSRSTLSASSSLPVNSADLHTLGRYAFSASGYADAYMAEVHFTDGTAYTADAFGELKNGVWVAKTPDVTYGTNGFYLDFANSADIGNDVSGEGNDWTPNNFTASDVVLDSPTDNFCTWNSVAPSMVYNGSVTLSDGNLVSTDGGTTYGLHSVGTIAVSSGKWYWETTLTSAGGVYANIGVVDLNKPPKLQQHTGIIYMQNGAKKSGDDVFTSGSGTAYGASYTTGDVIGIALNMDDNEITFYKNGDSQGVAFTGISGNYAPGVGDGQNATSYTFTLNCGQQDFTYTPPTDYLALSTSNLPDPVIDPAQDDQPRDYFETFLYTGNGAGLQVGDVIKKPADTTTISNSLIFNDNDSAYLSRTPASASNRKTWTWSGWVKKTVNDSIENLLGTPYSTASTNSTLIRIANNSLGLASWDSTVQTVNVASANLLRDNSAWYHIVLAIDTTQAIAANRVKLYVNGVEVSYSATTYPSQNYDTHINNNVGHYSGVLWFSSGGAFSAAQAMDGYMAEIHFVDGTAHAPTDFGNFDANGIWIPKAVTGITYGTNGFYLDFSDNTSTTTLGEDQTANGNDWTLNNFATTDQVADSPTNNFATLDPADSYSGAHTFSEGNLRCTHNSGTWRNARTGLRLTSGKWYWETVFESVSGAGGFMYGIGNELLTTDANPNTNYSVNYNGIVSGTIIQDGTTVNTGTAYTAGDVMGLALDIDAGTVKFYKNNTLVYTVSSITGNKFYPIVSASATGSTHSIVNFGQNSSFAGNKTAQGNTDDNGIGDFYYAPPTGYLALSENNITVDDQNLESPDFVWIKNRDQADKHHLYDSVRGVQNALYSNASTAETDEPNGLFDFNKNGFTVGSEVEVNTSGEDYVAWCWKANGTGVSNTEGTLTTAVTVSANTTSGFSICKWTGDGTAKTIGHGLDEKPEIIFLKNASDTEKGEVMYDNTTPTKSMLLFADADGTAAGRTSNYFSSVSTTTFGVGAYNRSNGNGDTMIAYCFHSVEGFSKIGFYEGNNSTDNAFVYTGFRPAWIMIKNIDAVGNWGIWDTKRNTYNIASEIQRADTPDAKATASPNNDIDILSNGFKVRGNTGLSGDAVTYIYMAFAETPFKYATAR